MNRTAAVLAAALAVAAPAFAASEQASHHAANEQKAGASDAFADGEVKKVDKSAGKVTIKHGPLAALDMPPMTMVFRVKDPAMLDQLKVGDRIRFKPEKVGGNYTVTAYEPAK
jgi:Cu(I)/Ag(I) efflux system periplasmic protein CusF